MKKVSTVAAKQSRNISQQKLTIGLDLGDRNSWYCVLDEAGQIQLEQRVRTSAKALRISECLALKWSDVDWLSGRLLVERGIVRQNVDDVKTTESRKKLVIDPELLSVLRTWKQTTEFSENEDWMFASPVQLGKLPWSYPRILQVFYAAGKDAEIGRLSTHVMRHTYRTWLDSVGTSVGVQQKLMRHADIRTTMNIYGDAVTPDMSDAHGKIVDLALNGMKTAGKPS